MLVFACVVTSRDSGNAVYGLIMPKNQLCMTGFTQCAPKVNCNRIHAVNQRIYVIFGNSLRGIAIIPENSIYTIWNKVANAHNIMRGGNVGVR